VWQLKSLICGTEERQALKETEWIVGFINVGLSLEFFIDI
jgi:hypothetical protein